MAELIAGNVRVELIDIGEGYNGDYDPDDPDDVALLRFYISRRATPQEQATGFANPDGWVDCDDGSYCTLLPVTVLDHPEQTARVLGFLMASVSTLVEAGEAVKKRGEVLSWVHLNEAGDPTVGRAGIGAL